MTLEEMIEIKMASLRAQSQSRPPLPPLEAVLPAERVSKTRPDAVHARSGGPVGGKIDGGGGKKSKGKRKGKGRPRAGSDPGPKLPKHDETDEESE